MVAIKSVKVGDTLYDVRKVKAGRTNTTRQSCKPVRILEIEEQPVWRAKVPRNNNGTEWLYESQVRRLKKDKPET